MGGNSPSRFSADDDDGGGGGGVTFVKGIRLSDKVIDRMKHSAKASCPHLSPEPQAQAATLVPAPPVEHLLPLLTPPPPQFVPTPPPTPSQEAVPTSPSVEAAPPVKLIPPPPVTFHSLPSASLDPAAPPPSLGPEPPSAPSSRPDNPEVPDSLAPPSAVEPIVLPPPESFILPHKEPESQTAPHLEEHVKEPVVLAPNWESSPSPEPPSVSCELVTPKPTQPAAVEPLESAAPSPPPSETVQVSPSPLDSAKSGASLSEAVADPLVEGVHSSAPPQPSAEGASPPCQCDEVPVVHTHVPGNVPPPELESPPPNEPRPVTAESSVTTFLAPVIEEEEPATTLLPTAGVVEEELRQKIRAELEKSLEEEINQKRQELQQQLEEVGALTRAEAKAAAQAQVAEQVRKTLEAERASHMEKLTESIARERVKAEDEKLMVQLYWMELKALQLEEREKEMKKRDELYKEHVSKLEAKCAEFYKVSSENFQKGKEETQKRFARFNIQPLCGDLQGQILKCYKENPGRTLTCSGIASAYMQCVDNAKKDKRITGG